MPSDSGNNPQPNNKTAPPEVPDFDLIRPVGHGGFGEVWLATNRTTGHLRAVKVIPLQQARETDPAAREIASLTRLEANLERQHPNLLNIHHVGKTDQCLFYVMDLADNTTGGPATSNPDYRPATLQSQLQGAPLSTDLCIDYARQLLAGLASLHEAGMVHRDVKPANCLFVDGQLKLADFGLVTDAHPLVSRVGTQKYMPPDGRMDMRADVYAAGLVIYEMISRLPVDEFPSLGNQAQRIRTDPTLAKLLELVLHACERDPDNRPPDARAMLAELDRPNQDPRPTPSRRWLLAAGAIVVFAVAAFGPHLFFAPTPPQKRCDVNFVTDPFEARIYLDGLLQTDPSGNAYTTPCTIPDLPARQHRVEFEYPGEPRWEAGTYDFSQTQQIVAAPPP